MILESGLREGEVGDPRPLGRIHFGLDVVSFVEEPLTAAQARYYHLDAVGSVTELTDA